MREQCGTDCGTSAMEGSEGAEAGGDVMVALKELWGLCVDWYGEALIRFGPETAHGMMIREEIPVQPSTPAPGPATISAVYVAGGTRALITAAADHATSFNWFVKRPGALDFVPLATKVKSPLEDLNPPAGVNTYQAEGH